MKHPAASRRGIKTENIYFYMGGHVFPPHTPFPHVYATASGWGSVIGQQGNIIHIYIEGSNLPSSIHFARLIIDDTALLRRLAEVLEATPTQQLIRHCMRL